jgi:hypothetical protein
MGLLLVVVMAINMVLALVMVPLLVFLFKPKFLSSEHHLLSESVDGLLDEQEPSEMPIPLRKAASR